MVTVTLTLSAVRPVLSLFGIQDGSVDVELAYLNTVCSIIYITVLCYFMSKDVIKILQSDPILAAQYKSFGYLDKCSSMRSSTSMKSLSTTSHGKSNTSTTGSLRGLNISLGSLSSIKISFKSIKDVRLKDILANEEYLELFMCHLAQEFSIECILSLIEFMQFKQLIFESRQVKPKSIRDFVITFPTSIPKSSIVYNTEETLRWKAEKLFVKYVEIGAEYEINVSSEVRNKLNNMFQSRTSPNLFLPMSSEKNPLPNLIRVISRGTSPNLAEGNQTISNDKMYTVFDECIMEMIKLLDYSLSRFKAKPQSQKIKILDE